MCGPGWQAGGFAAPILEQSNARQFYHWSTISVGITAAANHRAYVTVGLNTIPIARVTIVTDMRWPRKGGILGIVGHKDSPPVEIKEFFWQSLLRSDADLMVDHAAFESDPESVKFLGDAEGRLLGYGRVGSLGSVEIDTDGDLAKEVIASLPGDGGEAVTTWPTAMRVVVAGRGPLFKPASETERNPVSYGAGDAVTAISHEPRAHPPGKVHTDGSCKLVGGGDTWFRSCGYDLRAPGTAVVVEVVVSAPSEAEIILLFSQNCARMGGGVPPDALTFRVGSNANQPVWVRSGASLIVDVCVPTVGGSLIAVRGSLAHRHVHQVAPHREPDEACRGWQATRRDPALVTWCW